MAYYGKGVSAQVLTDNTAPTMSSWQTSFAPNAKIQLFDDFISNQVISGSDSIGLLVWSEVGAMSLSTSPPIDNAHLGIIGHNALSASPSEAGLYLGDSPGSGFTTSSFFSLGGGVITLNFVFKIVNLSTVTNRYTLRLGFGSTQAADQVNGLYFEYSDNINSGNWSYKSANASTRTTDNSSTTVTTGWHNGQIVVNAAASSVSFSVDGVSLGVAITTNIPATTTNLTPFIDINRSAGTIASNSILIDLFYYTQVLTVAR